MSPELNDLYLPVEAGLDDVLQHLVLTALTVDMEQVQVPVSSSDIVKGSGRLNDIQLDRLLCPSLFIFHGKSSLAFNIGLRQENAPGGFPQPVLVDSRIPLVGLDVILPNFLKISVENRNRLVNVKLTEM